VQVCESGVLFSFILFISTELENRFYSESSWASLSEHQVGKQKAKNNNKGIHFGVHSLSILCTSLIPAMAFSFTLLMTTKIS